MNRSEFQKLVNSELPRLFQAAREHDELAFLFALLGVNSEKDDAGWQPIGEAQAVVHDVLALINGPLHQHAKVRLALMLYCHIIETDFPYHCLYNLLLTVEGREPPKTFSFLDKYKSGIPPSVPDRLAAIKAKAIEHKFLGINAIFDQIVRADIRNVFVHSDGRSDGARAENRGLVQFVHAAADRLASLVSQRAQDHGEKIRRRARPVLGRGAGGRAGFCHRIQNIRRAAALVKITGCARRSRSPWR